MKDTKRKKLIPVVTALVLVLTLTIGTGCGGCLGCLGCIGCLGALFQDVDIWDDIDTDPWDITLPTRPSDIYETYEPETETETTTRPDRPSSKPSGTVTIGDGSFAYEEYDPTDFYNSCEELEALASGRDSDAVIDLFQSLYDEYEYIDEDGSILYVAYSENPSDEYLSDQYVEFDKMTTECYDKFMTAISAVCSGPCADAFKKYVGEDYFDDYASYEPLTDEQTELYARETELVDEYYSAIEDADEAGTSDDELVNIVGPIYIELVQVRTQLARTYGYDNYADYADENIYCRDFDGADARAFCDTVKKFSKEYYDLLYNSSAYFMPYYMNDRASTAELLDDLKTYADKISTYASDAAELLTSQELYSISDDGERMAGAYTISFEKSGVPFIFATTDGNPTDFTTLSHEFGHFTAFSNNMNPNLLIYSYGSLEISEIHSNGLQALYTYYFDKIYGSSADIMETFTVINLLSNVVDGCLFDEFQREVYANPDMTLDEINELYYKTCKAYGDPYASEDDYWWIHVHHNFESPMYYFSYAASGIVALEIWQIAQTDMDRAIDVWEQLIEAGSYTYGYMEILNMIGVADFTNTTAVLMTCQQALDYIDEHATKY